MGGKIVIARFLLTRRQSLQKYQLVVLPTDVVYSLQGSEWQRRASVCHCEEFDDPFDELRAGCGNPPKRGRDISILGKGSAGRLGMSS